MGSLFAVLLGNQRRSASADPGFWLDANGTPWQWADDDETLWSWGDGQFPADLLIAGLPLDAPSEPAPGYLETFVEPLTGTLVRQISATTSVVHHYSTTQAWNSNMTRLLFYYFLLDAQTYAVTHDLGSVGVDHYNARWSHVNPNLLYWTYGPTLRRYDVETDDDTVLHDYSGEFDAIIIGLGKGSLSNDDRYVPLACGNSGTYTHAVVWDLQTQAEIGRVALPTFAVSFVGISPSGQWVLIEGASETDYSDFGVKVYDKNLNFIGDLGDVGGHFDIAMDALGNEYVVRANVTLDGLEKTLLPAGSPEIFASFDFANISGHVSCRNIDRPGWVYYSFNKYALRHVDYIGAAPLVGTGYTELFGFTRSTASVYNSESQAVVSPDGTKMIFHSDWGVPGGDVYSYIVGLSV